MSRRCCYHRQRIVPFLEQDQIQAQAQAQDQDQDQFVRNVFRDIGNGDVHVDVDNVSVAVAVLVAVGLATGALEPEILRGYLDQLIART